jgi:glycosyltransferase involved in cell wall biosynthesis
MTRVALVTEIPAPYRLPVFGELARLLDGGLTVYFLSLSERRRAWGFAADEARFDFEVLGGIQLNVPYQGDSLPLYLSRPLLPRLVRGGYDAVVVGGWNHLECYEALAYCARRRRRFVLWSETPLLGALPARPLRAAFKRAVVRRSDRYVVPGPSAARYLAALGAPAAAIELAPNAVDVAYWSIRPDDLPPARRPSLLYVGRLARSKGVDVALRAFARSQLSGSWELVVAGDGPERADLERLAPPGVRFLGACDRDALRRLYHSADALVFPSRYDPWGLVLNEAACAGLPAVASDGAGATRDLVVDGVNGLVVRAGSVDDLTRGLDLVAADPGLAPRLGAEFRRVADTHTPAACAAGLARALS